MKTLIKIRRVLSIIILLLCFILIWQFTWFWFKLIITLAFVNFLISKLIKASNEDEEDDDDDDDDISPMQTNRFQDKLNKKIYGTS